MDERICDNALPKNVLHFVSLRSGAKTNHPRLREKNILVTLDKLLAFPDKPALAYTSMQEARSFYLSKPEPTIYVAPDEDGSFDAAVLLILKYCFSVMHIKDVDCITVGDTSWIGIAEIVVHQLDDILKK